MGIVKGASDISVKAISRNLVSREGRADFDYVEKRAPAKIEVYFSNSKLSDSVRMLEEERILVFPEDHVDFFPDPRLGVGSQITVRRASSVLLNDNGQSITYRTWGKRVGDFLAEKEIELGEYDVITPNKSALIEPGMTINITRADDGIQVEHFYTPFNVVVKDDPWLPSGKVRIKEAGIIGDRQLKWRVVKLQGGEIKRELLEDKMVSQVRDKLVSIGTKPVGFDGPYKDWINEAAVKYGADPDAMYRVMMCESGGYPYAQTTHGKYRGLFQYDNRTWSASGWGDHDIFDPYAQINAAAKAWASRYTKWPNTSRICGDLGR
ncbi:MAG: G5 domain-containing protein [bacterium]|nr:G5 domain-containing protein [bacterium]